jgi:hypothetical protein
MRIFVAGPWGDFSGASPETIMENIRRADEQGQRFVHQGHEVYIPHTMCKNWSGKFTQAEMQRLDKSFLDHWAEAIYRIPGVSKGADAEVAYALAIGLRDVSDAQS